MRQQRRLRMSLSLTGAVAALGLGIGFVAPAAALGLSTATIPPLVDPPGAAPTGQTATWLGGFSVSPRESHVGDVITATFTPTGATNWRFPFELGEKLVTPTTCHDGVDTTCNYRVTPRHYFNQAWQDGSAHYGSLGDAGNGWSVISVYLANGLGTGRTDSYWAVTPHKYTVSGHVSDLDGNPKAGTTISIDPSTDLAYTTTTASNGSYSLTFDVWGTTNGYDLPDGLPLVHVEAVENRATPELYRATGPSCLNDLWPMCSNVDFNHDVVQNFQQRERPTVAMAPLPPAQSSSNAFDVGWSGAAHSPFSVSNFDVRRKEKPYSAPSFGDWSDWQSATFQTSRPYIAAVPGTHCFSARTRASNLDVSSWADQDGNETCTIVPVDDRGLTASQTTTSATSTAVYYHKTKVVLTWKIVKKRVAVWIDGKKKMVTRQVKVPAKTKWVRKKATRTTTTTTRSPDWSGVNSPQYFRSTGLVTNKSGAAVTLAVAQFPAAVFVYVTKCPTCGSIRVTSGDTVLHEYGHPSDTISLHSDSTAPRSTILLPTGLVGPRTIKIAVLSSGSPVVIDAVGGL